MIYGYPFGIFKLFINIESKSAQRFWEDL